MEQNPWLEGVNDGGQMHARANLKCAEYLYFLDHFQTGINYSFNHRPDQSGNSSA